MDDELDSTVSHPDFSGPVGESLFTQDVFWLYDSKDFDHTNARVLEAIKREQNAKDDRALVLVSCLTVEASINEFIEAFAPRFHPLFKKRDYTLALKTELARALALCPSWLFDCADTIRAIRNEFAHDLNVESLDDISPDKLRRLAECHLRLYPGESLPSTPREIVGRVAGRTLFGLHLYRNQIRRLSGFIRSVEFMAAFSYFVNPILGERPTWFDNPDVGRSVGNGGLREPWQPSTSPQWDVEASKAPDED